MTQNSPPDTSASLSDVDGVGNLCDGCPTDPSKMAPGACGCGVPDLDGDADGVLDCDDACPGFPDGEDCNRNGVPDGCDIGGGSGSADANGNGVPDECECIGDLDFDGMILGGDLGLLLANWGQPGASDLDGDGTTGGADLGLLLAGWGACP